MNISNETKVIAVIFLVWFGLLMTVGFVARTESLYTGAKCTVKNQLPYYRWDSFWYTSIARHGYSFSHDTNSSIAFFPLYPAIIRVTHDVTGIKEDRVSFGLNILFSLLIVVFLYRLARLDYTEDVTRNIILAVLFFPPAYFFLSGYPDALFVLLTLLSLYFGRCGYWWRAGFFAALLALTKPYGIFMVPALLFEYLAQHEWQWRVLWREKNWWPLLLPLLTFGGFIVFNWLSFHEPLAFLIAQDTWGRALGQPLLSLFREARYFLSDTVWSGGHAPYLVYLGSFFFALVAGFLAWQRVRRSYVVFSLLILGSALLTGTLTSFGRYTLLGLALIMGVAVSLSPRKKIFWTYIFFSALLLLATANLFVRCYPFE